MHPSSRLQAFDQYLRDVTAKLSRKVEDLDDVRCVMGVLREVREMEANIDTLITPIDDMYSLLLRWAAWALGGRWGCGAVHGQRWASCPGPHAPGRSRDCWLCCRGAARAACFVVCMHIAAQ